MRYIILLCLFLSSMRLQAAPTDFKASAPAVVEVGEQFGLAYTLNKKGENIRIPDMEGFQVLMGPSVSSSYSYSFSSSGSNVDRKENAEYTYTYLLQGEKEGVFEIPAAEITVDGKQLRSNTVKITVVKGRSQNTASQGRNSGNNTRRTQPESNINEENLFVKVDVSKKNLYLGESLYATIKVYTRVNLVNLGQSKYPTFDGFLVEELPGPQRIELQRETYDNKVYEVAELRSVLLYPQHTGEIVIDPFEQECIVRQQYSSNNFFDDFFGNYQDVRIKRRSKPVTIKVSDLPQQNRPAGFSGTVGDIKMKTSISADSIRANDAVTYKITFSGSGNLKFLKAPVMNFPPDIETYEPKQTNNIKSGTNGMSGSVTYEYVLIPRFAGDYRIPAPRFSYFDTQNKQYKTIEGEAYVLSVAKGTETESQPAGSPAVQSFNKKEDVKILGTDIRYIKTEGLRLHPRGIRFYRTTAYCLCLILPLLVFVVGALFYRNRIKANADVVRVRNKKANKMADKRMKLAASAMKRQDSGAFYDEVLKALWGYMSYKLNIDTSALNRENVCDMLSQKAVSGELVARFTEVLDHAEFARYAPGSDAGKEMGRVYQESVEVITKLEKAINESQTKRKK